MLVYHGTTYKRAQRISKEGFLPRKPSRRVWFAEAKRYAQGRAKCQARRSHDQPVVLTCDVATGVFRHRYGAHRVFHRNGVIAVNGAVPVTVLRSYPGLSQPGSPQELAAWVNRLLGIKPYKGVGASHREIDRLSRWVVNRKQTQPNRDIPTAELIAMAKQWLPEYFNKYQVDPERLTVYPKVQTVHVKAEPPEPEPDPREDLALEALLDPSAKRRIKGLQMLAELNPPDLGDWCTMYADDEAINVRIAALKTMLAADEANPEPVRALAKSDNERLRAAAIAALAKHSGDDAPRWFARGLKDPSPCVRLATAAVLDRLDPPGHRAVFELALTDPNPQIVQLASKLTNHKGYAPWRH
jgi:hypothetical protein